jgi:hypothetical protein
MEGLAVVLFDALPTYKAVEKHNVNNGITFFI